MRIELQQLEQIDAYLSGSMNADAKASFELEIQQSANLRELLENQKLMIHAIQRQALLAEINQFSGTSGIWTIAKWLSVSVITAGLLAAGIYWKYNLDSGKEISQTKTTITTSSEIHDIAATMADTSEFAKQEFAREEQVLLPGQAIDLSLNPMIEKKINEGNNAERGDNFKSLPKAVSKAENPSDLGGLKTWITPKRQYFEVDPKKGETIECEDGTLVIVPSDAFLDKNGDIVVEHVRIEIVEALSVADMLAYNLTTMNDEKHLQSGGMIYVQPTVQGERVDINPKRPLYIEVPTTKEIPGMLAWKGETDAQGNINWKDPKALEKFLTPVNFELLDFLPPGFADEVEASLPFRNHKIMRTELADSLYYSLAVKDQTKGSMFMYKVDAAGEMLEMKKNTYSFNGKVIDQSDEPLQGVKIRVFSYTEPDIEREGHYDSTRIAKELQWSRDFNKKIPTGILFDSIITNAEGSFSLTNMKQQNIYFSIEHPDFQKYISPDLILPLNRILTFQPVVKLKRIKMKAETKLAAQISKSTFQDSVSICMIDPVSIKAIKAEEFSKTFLSTKEFEERLQVLHQMPNPQALLELYVNGLNRNLWEIDSLAAQQLSGENRTRFLDFAAQKKTNVKNKNIYQEQLTAYYNKKRGEYATTMAKMAGQFSLKSQEELYAMGEKVNSLSNIYLATGFAQSKVPAEKEADYRAVQPNPAVNYSYAVSWDQPGWMNIDCYKHLLENGSKDVAISVSDKSDGRVYQSINILKTIIPLSVVDGKATAKFPLNNTPESEQMKSAFCIGIQKVNGEISYAEKHYDPYENGEIQLEWKTVTEKELYAELCTLPHADTKFISFLKTQEQQILRQQEIKFKQEALAAEIKLAKEKLVQENAFIARLKKIAGSCGVENCRECDREIVRVLSMMPKWDVSKIKKFPFKTGYKFPVELDIATNELELML